MAPAIQREGNSEKKGRSRLSTDDGPSLQSSATSHTDSLAPGFSDDGADGHGDTAEEYRQNSSSFKSIGSAASTVSTPFYKHKSDRHGIYHTANPHGPLNREQRPDYRQVGTRAWLFTPQAYEVGVGRKERDGDIHGLYTMMQEVGLSAQTSKDDRDLQRKAGLKPQRTAAEERRRLELAGVGAWTNANAMGRVR
jgi:hypothetical protein